VRAYSHRGDRLVWLPPPGPARCAVDLECASRFDSVTLRVLGLHDTTPGAEVHAASLWLAAELEAKILATPILHLWHTHRSGLTPLTDSPSLAPLSGSERLGRCILRTDGKPPLWIGFARLAQNSGFAMVPEHTLAFSAFSHLRPCVQGSHDLE